ncbi:MAG: hypothetical protein QM535_07235 [Limnohabitans sp.]|nr:hypothetical protein [Limnohabitans sp.]
MRTLLYSFSILTLLISPVTCTMDSKENTQSPEQISGVNDNSNNNVSGIDPIIIPTKPN